MHFNGQTFSRVSEKLSFTSQYFGKNVKNHLFEEKKVVLVVFIEFKYKSLPSGLADLNKSQTLEISLV